MVGALQGEIWWVELDGAAGSGTSYRNPVLVVQGDALNRSRILTVVCVPLTSNLSWARSPGNVLLPARPPGLSKDSVANVSQLVAVEKRFLKEWAARLASEELDRVRAGIDLVLGARGTAAGSTGSAGS
ncbi:MAG TPA: type II toxin-antitoxin system PemK/MazF family toxin [Gammaproteobacteria bacterium]|nr:type II toxin-antitoxin system PemK/MazF family toxin [Gammaproteobacteria bacterium]